MTDKIKCTECNEDKDKNNILRDKERNRSRCRDVIQSVADRPEWMDMVKMV